MKIGDEVSIPAPDLSNHQWDARRFGRLVALNGNHARVLLTDGGPVEVPAEDVMTVDEMYDRMLTP